MKILQIFALVVAVHLFAFIFIFASPGCQSSTHNVPTPDATLPTASAPAPTVSFPLTTEPTVSTDASMPTTYAPDTTPGRASPTRPGSPNAVAVTPARSTAENVAPVSTYTVSKGDSLWSIAKKNHLTVGELAKANSLGAGATLQPGKKLIIPGKVAAAPLAPSDLSTTPAHGGSTTAAADKHAGAPRPAGIDAVKHTVQTGESLSSIAHKYQVKPGELAAANGISDPSKIRVGQELVIPGFKAVGSKPGGTKAGTKPASTAAADKAAADAAAAAAAAPHFEIKAPPPGQDLDAGLKGNPSTDVPTIKVDEVKTDDSNKK